MATKNVKVNIDINNNLKSVEDLKVELRTLEQEFETVSVGSQRFNELGNQIKKTRSQLKDIELQFEGLDKEQRATALVDTFNGLTGAVGAVSSAFIAFGSESKAIEDAEKKLLGVIGVVSGLRDVSNAVVSANKLLGPSFSSIGDSIKAAFTTGTGAVNGFRVALASIGIGLVVAGVAALVANFDKLFPAAKSTAEQLGFTNEELDTLSKEAAKSTTEVNLLVDAVLDQTNSEKQRQDALDELNKKYPTYFGNLVQDINDTGALIAQKNKLIDTLIREARVRASQDKIAEIASKNIGKRIQLQEQLTKAEEKYKTTVSGVNDILKTTTTTAKDFTLISAEEFQASLENAGATEKYTDAIYKSNIALGELNGVKNKIAELDRQELKDAAVYLDVINTETDAIEANGGASNKAAVATKGLTDAQKAALATEQERAKFILKINEELLTAQEKYALDSAKTEEERVQVQYDNTIKVLKRQREAELAEAERLNVDKTKINEKYDTLEKSASIDRQNALTEIEKQGVEKRLAERQKELTQIDEYYARLLDGIDKVADDIAIAQGVVSEKQFDEINKFITTALAQSEELVKKSNEELEKAGDNAAQVLRKREEDRARIIITALEKQQLERKANFEKQLQDEKLTEEQRKEIQTQADKDFADFQAKKLAVIDATAKKIVEIDTNTAQQQKQNTVDLVSFTQSAFTSLFSTLRTLNEANAGASEAEQRKAFERNKSYATAEALVNTFLSVTKIFANAAANPKSILFPAQPYIEAALATAAGLATVAKIRNTQFNGSTPAGGAGGMGTSTGTVGGSTGGGTNILNPFQGQGGGGTNILPPRLAPPSGGGTKGPQTAQASFGGEQVPVVRAYVLAGDVTEAVDAEAKINQKRQF